MFYLPLSAEITKINQKLDGFLEKLQQVNLKVVRPVSNREEMFSKAFDAGILLLVYALQWVFLKPRIENSVWWELNLYWTYSLIAIPYGAWLGFRRPRRGVAYFILVGMGLGLADCVIRGRVYQWTWSESWSFFIRDLLWFYTGSILGRKLAGWVGRIDAGATRYLTAADIVRDEVKPSRTVGSLNERGETLKAYAAV